MKFWAGVMLGLLLGGPSITNQYPTEQNSYIITVTPYTEVPIEEVVDYSAREIEGQEWCIVEMLGGPGANWTSQDVIDILDQAWTEWNGPCDMMERRGESDESD